MTGGFIRFLNRKCARNSLGIFFIGGFPVTKALVVFAGQGYRADFRAVTTACTFCRVYVPGVLGDKRFKIVS
jgi:hypothetical protein